MQRSVGRLSRKTRPDNIRAGFCKPKFQRLPTAVFVAAIAKVFGTAIRIGAQTDIGVVGRVRDITVVPAMLLIAVIPTLALPPTIPSVVIAVIPTAIVPAVLILPALIPATVIPAVLILLALPIAVLSRGRRERQRDRGGGEREN